MATQRVSRLQKQMLRWLLTDHHRTRGVLASSHEELVKALGGDKGNISHSLRTLEARGWIVLGRTPGGRAESLYLRGCLKSLCGCMKRSPCEIGIMDFRGLRAIGTPSEAALHRSKTLISGLFKQPLSSTLSI
jgi:hypothetical protein